MTLKNTAPSPFVAQPLTPAGKSATGASVAPQIITTETGLTVWLVEDHSVPVISLNFASPSGTVLDPVGKPGLGLLTRTLLDEGAGDLAAEAFHEAIEDAAIELSFSLDADYLKGAMRTMVRNCDRAFELLGLALNKPRFDEPALLRMRGEIEAGLKREIMDPEAIVSKNWNRLAYGIHPLAQSRNGTLETLESLTREAVIAHAKGLLVRDGLKLAVVGAIDAKTLIPLLDHVFGNLPANNPARKSIAPCAMQGLGDTHVFEVDLPQTALRFGRPGLMRSDPDFIPASVFVHIFGGGAFTSRLWQEIREKRGLAYSVYMRLAYNDFTATMSGMTHTKNERAYESLSLIHEQMALLAKIPPTDDELEKAKDYLIGNYPLRFDTSMHIAGELVQMQIDGLGLDWLTARKDTFAKVTMDDIVRVTKRLFGDETLLVTMAGRPVKP